MISMDKTYTTRVGREVRIYATDGAVGDQQIHGAVKTSDGWRVTWWNGSGGGCRADLDLIEVKPERTVWVNFYSDGVAGAGFLARADADSVACPNRIACVKVTFREGDGL